MKTLRKSKLLGIILAAFMALVAFFGILATVPRSANAFPVSDFEDIPESQECSPRWINEQEYDKTAIGGKYFKITPYDKTSDLSDNLLFVRTGVFVLRYQDGNVILGGVSDDGPYVDYTDKIEVKEVTSKYFVVYFPEDFSVSHTMSNYQYDIDATQVLEIYNDEEFNVYTTVVEESETYDLNEKEYDGTALAGKFFRIEMGGGIGVNITFSNGLILYIDILQGVRLVDPDINFHILSDTSVTPEVLVYGITRDDEGTHYFIDVYFPHGIIMSSDSDDNIDLDKETATFERNIEGVYELVNLASNPSGSGGSSVNQNNKTNNEEKLDVIEIIALVLAFAISTIIESIYVIKVPNSKAKWIMLLVLIAGFAIAEGALYMYFTGTI